MRNTSAANSSITDTKQIEIALAGSVIYVVVMALILVAAIFGNLLVLIAVYRTSTLKRTTAVVLVVNLASVDFLVTLFIVPFVMVVAVLDSWTLPPTVCMVTGFLNAFLTAAQLFALFHISVNRYIAVAFPHSYESRCTKKLTVIMIAIGWLYSLLWTLMPFFGWGEIGFDKGSLYCNILWNQAHLDYAITLQTVCYIAPALLALILYLTVYRRVRARSRTFLKSFASTLTLDSVAGVSNVSTRSRDDINTELSSCGSNDQKESTANCKVEISDTESRTNSSNAKISRKRRAMEIRVTRTLLAVGLCFAVCWFPRGVANLWAVFVDREAVPRALEFISTAFIFANAAVNPVLYAAFHQEFNRAFRRVLCCESGNGKNNNSKSYSNKQKFSIQPSGRKNSIPLELME